MKESNLDEDERFDQDDLLVLEREKAIKLLVTDFQEKTGCDSLPKALGKLFTKAGAAYLIGSQQKGTKRCFIKHAIKTIFPEFHEKKEEEVEEELEEYQLLSSRNIALLQECQERNTQELPKWFSTSSSQVSLEETEETQKFLAMLLVSLTPSTFTVSNEDSDFDLLFGNKLMIHHNNFLNTNATEMTHQHPVMDMLFDYAIHFGFSIGTNDRQNNTHLNHLMNVCAPFIKKESRLHRGSFIKIDEKGEGKSFEHFLIFIEQQHDSCIDNPLTHKDFRKMIVLLRSSIKKNILEKITHTHIQKNSIVTSYGILNSLKMVFVIEMNGILNGVGTDSDNVGISYHLSLIGRFDVTSEIDKTSLKKTFKSIMTTHSQTNISKCIQKFNIVSTPYYSKIPSSNLHLVNFQDFYNIIRLTKCLSCEFAENIPYDTTIEITHETFFKDSQFFVKSKGRSISRTILYNYKRVYSILGTDQNNATLIWFFIPIQKRTVRSASNNENNDNENSDSDENPKPSKSQKPNPPNSTYNTLEEKQSHSNTSSSTHSHTFNEFPILKDYLQKECNIKINQSFSKRMKQDGITICGKAFPLDNILKSLFIKISLYYNSNRTENEDLMMNIQKDTLENVCSIVNYEKKTIQISEAGKLFESEVPKQSSYDIYITTMTWHENIAEFCLSFKLTWFRDRETRISTLNLITEQIKKGINDLHARSIIHCDICISNILVSAYFKPFTRDLTLNSYITDFNHSKYENQDCSLVLFKPAYSPVNTLLMFKKEHDWYALGIVIAQLVHLFSKSYETEDDLISILQDILREEGNASLVTDAFSRISHLENELDYSNLIQQAKNLCAVKEF